MTLVAALFVLALAACGSDTSNDTNASAGAQADGVGTPDGLLRWISRHRTDAGLMVIPDHGRVLSLAADRRSPLASTRKVLIVGALAASDISPTERVTRQAVERYYAPGTDAGAHRRAQLDDARPTLRQLARAALEVSDNASADALLYRVGARAVDAWGRGQGLTSQDPIMPVLGELAGWTRDAQWAKRSPSDRAHRALAFGRDVSASKIDLPAAAQQRRLAASSVAGTPAQWAQLMHHIGHRGDPELIAALDWPRRRSKQTARKFDRYLTKGGSLPGVITEASYIRPAGGSGAAVALFLRDLPPDIERKLGQTFAQQKLIARLATDAAFLDRARHVLGEK